MVRRPSSPTRPGPRFNRCRRRLAALGAGGPTIAECERDLIADRGYSYPTCRRLLRGRRIAHAIPERSDQQVARARRGARGGRPPQVDPVRYRQRNVVERAVARLKQHRAIVTGYDNLAASYHTWLVLAALLLWPHEPSNKP